MLHVVLLVGRRKKTGVDVRKDVSKSVIVGVTVSAA